MLPQETSYRIGVAAFVINGLGQILACRRADQYESWQIPQGGIEDGETLKSALLRELEEEIGTNNVDIIGALSEPIAYDWPEDRRHQNFTGQTHYYFLVKLKERAEITLDSHPYPEFNAVQWVTLHEFINLLSCFKKSAYLEAIEQLIRLFPGYIKE